MAPPSSPPSSPWCNNHSFTVLHDKALAVERVALCPKMDLIAVLTADGALVILRTISWQKLHALPATDLQDDNRVTALAWSPDGNVLALGHARGGLSLFDVEKGDPSPEPLTGRPDVHEHNEVVVLTWQAQYRDPRALSPTDREQDQAHEAAKYYLHRDEVFLEDLPALGQASGSSFAAPKERKEDPIGAKLTANPASLDVLIACFKTGGILFLSSGLFPILSLRLQDLVPASALPSFPLASPAPGGGGAAVMLTTPSPSGSITRMMAAASPSPSCPSASVLTSLSPPVSSSTAATPLKGTPGSNTTKKRPCVRIQSVAATPDLASFTFAVGHGRESNSGATSLLALHTPVLWRNRHQLKPVTSEFSALSSLVAHLQEALDLAERHWKDSSRTLDIKLELFNNLLRDYACQASAREAFLSFILSGVACPALNQYLSQNSSEPQQHNMFRLSKTVDEKCVSVEALLREQIGRVAEMVVFRASKLRGMARMGDGFQEIGLSAPALSALVDAAVRLSLKAEEALKEVQEARQNLKVFLLWLLDTMQHQPAENAAAPPRDKRLTFRHSTKHIRLLLAFLRKPLPPPPPPGQPKLLTNTEAIIAVQVSAYFKDEPLPLPNTSSSSSMADDDDNISVAEGLSSISLRTQVNEVRAQFEAVFKRPLEALKAQLSPCRMLPLSSTPLVAPPQFYAPPFSLTDGIRISSFNGSESNIILTALVQAKRTTLLCMDMNEKTWQAPSSFFPVAGMSLSPPDSDEHGRIFQQAALYGQVTLVPSQNEDSLVLLVRGSVPVTPDGGRTSAEVWKVPLTSLTENLTPLPLPSFSSSDVAMATPLLDDTLLPPPLALPRMTRAKGREVSQMAPSSLSLAVTGTRGVATVTSRANYLLLLDMEEDEEDEEEEEEEENGVEMDYGDSAEEDEEEEEKT